MEWINFHLKQGVDYFYIVDNGSTDNTRDILASCACVSPAFLTYKIDRDSPIQFKAYNEALRCMRDGLPFYSPPNWVACIDADEFLYSPKGLLPDTLRNYQNASAVQAHWVLYGSNGHEEYSNKPVVERFTKRAKAPDKHTKAILKPLRTYHVGQNPHYFAVRGKTVDENGNVFGSDFAGLQYEGGTIDLIRINHYHTKSKAEYYERKLTKPDPGHGRFKTREEVDRMWEAHDVNEIEDLSAVEAANLWRS